MSLKNSIKAFTVIEVTVTLLISTIVIIMAFKTYMIFHQNFLRITAKNSFDKNVIWLEKNLARDMEDSRLVFSNDSLIIFLFDDSMRIDYYFTNKCVLRVLYNGAIGDTLMRYSSFELYNDRNRGDYKKGDVIDYLSIILKDNNYLGFIKLHKIYASDMLIQIDRINKSE